MRFYALFKNIYCIFANCIVLCNQIESEVFI
nr:MAG TPA: hypothetical protein [Caudoviricetes sp.]